MIGLISAYSRQVAALSVIYGLLGIVVTGCETVWGGKPPGGPAPTDPAIDEVAELVEEHERDRARFGYLLRWISELERFCASLDEMRRG